MRRMCSRFPCFCDICVLQAVGIRSTLAKSRAYDGRFVGVQRRDIIEGNFCESIAGSGSLDPQISIEVHVARADYQNSPHLNRSAPTRVIAYTTHLTLSTQRCSEGDAKISWNNNTRPSTPAFLCNKLSLVPSYGQQLTPSAPSRRVAQHYL
jgi:hypothetical protein